MTDSGDDQGPAGGLQVRTYHHGGRLVIEALGSVALATRGPLEGALDAAVQDGGPGVTVDLRRVDFLDGSGLALLAEASKRLRTSVVPRAPRVLVMPGRQPERVLRLSGFDVILEIAHDIGGVDGT